MREVDLDRGRDRSAPIPSAGRQPDELMREVEAWIEAEMRRLDPEAYGLVVACSWRRLSLCSAGTRWGSASADGAIRLNWRLIHFALPVIDYVVAHELSAPARDGPQPALLGRGALGDARR
jgi:hypothetical protein